MRRGRRNADQCEVGDVIDAWTVEAFEPDRLLRLSADLKLPGRGWLEFEVQPLDGGRRSMIRQTATFDPRGLLGSAYWYAIYPVHALIFRGLLRRIAERAARGRSLAIALMALTVFMMTPLHAQQPTPVRTVEAVDLDRYLGDWFEIARLPNRFQKNCVGDVRAHYARRADGRIDVINRCQTRDGLTEARGVARVVDRRTSAKLKVRFAPAFLSWLPAVWGDYWILGLADDYSWAVVGSPDRQYLWILARAPVIGGDRFALALGAARDNGFDTARLEKTSQTAPAARKASTP